MIILMHIFLTSLWFFLSSALFAWGQSWDWNSRWQNKVRKRRGTLGNWLKSKNSDVGRGGIKEGVKVTQVWRASYEKNILEWRSRSGALKIKVQRRKTRETKSEDSGWRVKVDAGVCVTVSKPQEQQRKAVNGSSPCPNRLWTVLQSTANQQSSWRLLWVRALTRCLPPDQGDDAGEEKWKRERNKTKN